MLTIVNMCSRESFSSVLMVQKNGSQTCQVLVSYMYICTCRILDSVAALPCTTKCPHIRGNETPVANTF